MTLALIIAVPFVLAAGLLAWCLVRAGSRRTPRPDTRIVRCRTYDRALSEAEIDQRYREHEGDDTTIEVGPRRHCPDCGTRRPFGPATIIVEGQASWQYLECRRCHHMWVVTVGGDDDA